MARLFIKPEYRSRAFHQRPYNLSESLRRVLAVLIQKAFESGRFLALNSGEECLHSFPIFLVDKCSLIKLQNQAKPERTDSPLDPASFRLVVDASRQSTVLVDSVNSSTIRPLSNHLISEALADPMAPPGEEGIISHLDIAGAFDRLILRASDRKYQGLVLPAGYPTCVSVPVIQGSPVSPALFTMALDRALSTSTRETALTFLDDVLLANKKIDTPAAYSARPDKAKLADLPEDLIKESSTLHPHDPEVLTSIIRRLDPLKLLPVAMIVTSFFAASTPVNKGQDWGSVFKKTKDYPSKKSNWTIPQIRNHFKNLSDFARIKSVWNPPFCRKMFFL